MICWKYCRLTRGGRGRNFCAKVVGSNTFDLLASLHHYFYSSHHARSVKEINDMFYHFLWDGKGYKINYDQWVWRPEEDRRLLSQQIFQDNACETVPRLTVELMETSLLFANKGRNFGLRAKVIVTSFSRDSNFNLPQKIISWSCLWYSFSIYGIKAMSRGDFRGAKE